MLSSRLYKLEEILICSVRIEGRATGASFRQLQTCIFIEQIHTFIDRTIIDKEPKMLIIFYLDSARYTVRNILKINTNQINMCEMR